MHVSPVLRIDDDTLAALLKSSPALRALEVAGVRGVVAGRQVLSVL